MGLQGLRFQTVSPNPKTLDRAVAEGPAHVCKAALLHGALMPLQARSELGCPVVSTKFLKLQVSGEDLR